MYGISVRSQGALGRKIYIHFTGRLGPLANPYTIFSAAFHYGWRTYIDEIKFGYGVLYLFYKYNHSISQPSMRYRWAFSRLPVRLQ